MKLLLTLLAVCVCTASAIVCLPGSCDSVDCAEPTPEMCSSRNAVLVPNATLCGCCAACIKQLSMIIIGVIFINNVINTGCLQKNNTVSKIY
jgi:hypothetical protein